MIWFVKDSVYFNCFRGEWEGGGVAKISKWTKSDENNPFLKSPKNLYGALILRSPYNEKIITS